MNLKIIVLVLILLPVCGLSENINLSTGDLLELPDGVKIVPRAKLGFTEEELIRGAEEDLERKQKGYVNEKSNRAFQLIDFESYSKRQLELTKNNHSSSGTHLRPFIRDLKLAFYYRGVPYDSMAKNFGASPGGGYRTDGWTQATQFFYAKDIGNCAFIESDAHITQSSIEIALEAIEYLVNKKPSLIDVRGSAESGFLYDIQWFDGDYFRELECANIKFSKTTLNNIIELAKRIDDN